MRYVAAQIGIGYSYRTVLGNKGSINFERVAGVGIVGPRRRVWCYEYIVLGDDADGVRTVFLSVLDIIGYDRAGLIGRAGKPA